MIGASSGASLPQKDFSQLSPHRPVASYIFMKTLLTTFTVLVLLASISPASAEPEEKKQDKNRPEWSSEIRERFQAARMKAMQDPEIQKLQIEARAANDKFFQAARKKMTEIDPGLSEIVRKKRAGKGDRHGQGPDEMDLRGPGLKDSDRPHKSGRPGGPNPRRSGFGSLDENERKTLQEARKKAKSDPAVQAALAKKEAAQTPEDREAAGEEYRKTIHGAMLKADPTLEPLLKKLAPKSNQASAPAPDQEPKADGEMMQ